MSAIKSCICWMMIITFTVMNVGCGTIFGGTRQTIQVSSNPPGASVTAGQSGMTQTTPTSFNLLRKDNYALVFEKEGYESRKYEVKRGIRAGILVLDILLGLVPVIVDAATGAWYKLSPETVEVTLTKKGGASLDLPDTIRVSLAMAEGMGEEYSLRVTSSVPGVRVHIEPAKSSQR